MIIYSKFNNYRKSEFQLITKIEKKDNNIYSTKTALNSKSHDFLNSIFNKYEYLNNNRFSFKPIKPIKSGQNKIQFEYQNTKTLEYLLYRQLIEKNKNKFLEIIKKYIKEIKKNKIQKEYLTEKFNKIFNPKKHSQKKEELLNTGCIDLNFNNIFFNNKNNKYYLIDYEWTFDFPIPYKYIIFRAITDFYSRYYQYKPNDLLSLEMLYKVAEITSTQEKEYISYEYNFQKYVNNNEFAKYSNEKIFYKNYQALKQNFELKKYFNELSELKNENQNLNKQIEEVNQKNILLQKNVRRLKSDLTKIQSSKTYIAWQKFNKIKRFILKKKVK